VYKAAKRLADKGVTIAKGNAFDRLYRKLEAEEGGKEVFKLARAREKKIRDLESVRCVKGEDCKVLVLDTTIRERWQGYFSLLFNGGSVDSLCLARGVQEGYPHDRACSCVSKEEVKDVLRRVKSGKAVGLNLIPIEIWKCLGERGLGWLTELFNVIFRTLKMPN